MTEKRILSLDVSTKTGWALLISSDKGPILEAYGQIPKVECPEEEPYPGSYVTWAYQCFNPVEAVIEECMPDILVIEEVTKSQNPFSQKILDYIHFLLAKFIKETGIPCVYMMTGQWRSAVGSYMNVAEKKHNAAVRKYKEKNKSKIAYDENGKRIGIIGKKHVTIRLINDTFKGQLKKPLIRKDEDTADAIALALAHHLRRMDGYE